MDFIKDFTITKEEGSQVKIEGEIPFAELEKHRGKTVQQLGKNMEIDGFRKGHVPDKVVVERVGEMALLAEMAERAIAAVYPTIIKEHQLDVIGYPEVSITKIAPNNPLGFTAKVAVLPKIELPDFKKIASDINKDKTSTEVTEEEVQTQIKDILRQKRAYERLQEKAKARAESGEAATETETHVHADGTVHEGPSHDHDDDHAGDIKDAELPELTDDYVKALGQPGQFASVEDFKSKVKEHLAIEKEREVVAAHRAKITDAIIKETHIELPQILIDSELNQMFAQMEDDLKRAHLKLDDYLGHIKKTKEDLKKEWAPAAKKRATLQLVLNEIATVDGIKPDPSQLDAQVDQLLEQYRDADESRVRIYVASVMTNEAVMQKLESL